MAAARRPLRVARRSLACDQDLTPTDALLLENFDPDYLVFERARLLRKAGVAQRALVPTNTDDNGALNAGYRIREFLEREHIRSVTVVAHYHRSRRSALVYRATPGPAGITVRCVPVPHSHDPEIWLDRWHGIQNVAEPWAKLQYYRVGVLPFVRDAGRSRTRALSAPGAPSYATSLRTCRARTSLISV